MLVALSLLLPPCGPAEDDKHKPKASIRSIRAKAKKFLAFAYTSTGLTSQGKKPVPGATIAADPKVLPIGSRVRVLGAGKYSGDYTVSDTGGKIRGKKIDIFMSSTAEALQFGRKEVQIVLLNSPA